MNGQETPRVPLFKNIKGKYFFNFSNFLVSKRVSNNPSFICLIDSGLKLNFWATFEDHD